MRAKLVVAVALLLALVTAGTIVMGPDILADEDAENSGGDSFPTETSSEGTVVSAGVDTTADGDGGSDSGSSDDETARTTTPTEPFATSVVAVEECGETCRDVTLELTNQQDTSAQNVTVYARIFAGQGTDGDVVWTGTERVGTLEPAESVTATKRVELGFSEAFAIQQEDGWITIQTTVQSEDETMTVTEQRDVA